MAKVKTKFTEETRRTLLDQYEAGATNARAAEAAKIGPTTLRLWIKKGRAAADGPYHDFVQAIEQARGRSGGLVTSQSIEHGKVAGNGNGNGHKPKEDPLEEFDPEGVEPVRQALVDFVEFCQEVLTTENGAPLIIEEFEQRM